MKKIYRLTLLALIWESVALAYDPAVITADDLKVLKEFDKRYYSSRHVALKKADIALFTRWVWENMRMS